MASTVGKIFVELLLSDEQFRRELDAAGKDVKKFGLDLSGVADAIQGLFTTAIKGATAAMAGFAAATAYTGAQFEKDMKQVGVIAGATDEQLGQLTDKARELGKTTAFSASEAADAMKILSGAGLDTNQVLTVTGDVLALAGAGSTTLDIAAASLVQTLAQFNLNAEESGRVSDVFAKATAASQFTVDDLSQAMSYGATTGAGFGFSLEQTVAALSAFRDAGLKGSAAGTALRSVLSQASQESARNVGVLEKYGLTMDDISFSSLGFAGVMKNVAAANISAEDSLVLFGVEAGTTFLNLAKQAQQGGDTYTRVLGELGTSAGTASAMFAEMSDTTIGKFDEVSSATEELMLTLFDTFGGDLKGLFTDIAAVINEVVDIVQIRSGDIGEGFDGIFGPIRSFLQENKASIGIFFADLIEGVQTVIRTLLPLLPLLDDIAIALAGVFLAIKVASWVSSIQQAVTAVGGLAGGIRGLMVTVAAASGGTYALVAALGVLVATLGALTYNYMSADNAARGLEETQDRIAAKNAEADSALKKQVATALAAQQAKLSAQQAELTAAGKLTDIKEQELALLAGLDPARAAAEVLAGRLALVNGELRTVASIYEDLKTGKSSDAFVALNQQTATLTSESEDLAKELAQVKNSYEQAIAGGSEVVRGLAKGLRDGIGVDATVVLMSDLQGKIDANAQKLATIRSQQLKGEKALLDMGTKKTDGEVKGSGKRVKASEDETKAKANDLEQLADLEQRLAMERLQRTATEADVLRAEGEQRRIDAEALFQDAISKTAAGSAERIALEKRLSAVIVAINAETEAKISDITKRADADRKAEADRAAAAVDAERLRDRQNIIQKLDSMEMEHVTEIQRLEIERNNLLSQLADEDIELAFRISEAYAKLIEKAREKQLDADKEAGKKRIAESRKQSAAVAAAWGDAFLGIAKAAGSAIMAGIDGLMGIFTKISGLDLSAGGILDSVMEAEKAKAELVKLGNEVTTGLTEAEMKAREEQIAELETASKGIGTKITEGLSKVIDELPNILGQLIAELPAALTKLASQLPTIAGQLVDGLVALLVGVLDAMPNILGGILDKLPELIGKIGEGAAALVRKIAEILPVLLVSIAEALPEILTSLLTAVVDVAVAIAQALPSILTAVMQAATSILGTVVDFILEAINALVGLVPVFINEFSKELPKMLPALIGMMIKMTMVFLTLAPQIAWEFVKAFITEFLPQIPNMVVEFIKSIVNSIGPAIDAFIKGIGDFFAGLFGAKGKDGTTVWQKMGDGFVDFFKGIGDLFKGDKNNSGAFSGMDYVPQTMRLTVHKGEAILDASRNAQRRQGGPGATGYRQNAQGGQGRGGEPINVIVSAEGRVLEAAQFTAMERGTATKLDRYVKKTTGTRLGLVKGKYNPYGS